MTKFVALCFIIALVIIGYINANSISQRMNEDDITKSVNPYHVSIRFNKKHICSGVLINDRFVLTTAYCICNYNKNSLDNFTVHTGNILGTNCGEKYSIKNVKCHPHSKKYDLAVIMLAKKVQPSLQPLSLNSNTSVGEYANISGWAVVRPFTLIKENLKDIKVQIIDNKECQENFEDAANILSSHICTFLKSDIKFFKGDNGNPLISNNALMGIFSNQTYNSKFDVLSIFNNINVYKEFIIQTIKELEKE